jgi:hypothetical protein
MANSEKEKIRGRLYIIDKPTNIYMAPTTINIIKRNLG